MRKIEVSPNRFILYNDSFFVKRCEEHIVWTTNRHDALIMAEAEANEVMEKNNRFLAPSP
jgi:hypothetical protein